MSLTVQFLSFRTARGLSLESLVILFMQSVKRRVCIGCAFYYIICSAVIAPLFHSIAPQDDSGHRTRQSSALCP